MKVTMFCCANCFKDFHIRKIIEANNNLGTCNFCSSQNVPILDVDKSKDVSNCISDLLQLYTVSKDDNADYIEYALINDWNIFALKTPTQVKALIKALCPPELKESEILTQKVINPLLYDKEFLNDYGVARGLSWKDFSTYIKTVNRFHSNFNSGEFASCLTPLRRHYKKGTHFYRARIAENGNGFKNNEMKAPPRSKSGAGRINPEGMPVLYLSTDKNTVLYEVRANMYDFVSIGEFITQKDLQIVDLSGFENISPFIYEGGLERFAINFKIFQEISTEIAKPLRRNDSPLEYLPTQFIAEFIKRENYDGVEYKSTISREGRNIALFDENLVTCLAVQTVEITNMNYTASPVD